MLLELQKGLRGKTMIVVRCRDCNKELKSDAGRTQTCGCSNMVTVKGDSVTARDLNRVYMINTGTRKKNTNVLSDADIAWQESRKKRKIRKIDFEER